MQPDFSEVIASFLNHANPHIRIKVLGILNALGQKYSEPTHYLRDKKLQESVSKLAVEDNSAVVRSMANKLLGTDSN